MNRFLLCILVGAMGRSWLFAMFVKYFLFFTEKPMPFGGSCEVMMMPMECSRGSTSSSAAPRWVSECMRWRSRTYVVRSEHATSRARARSVSLWVQSGQPLGACRAEATASPSHVGTSGERVSMPCSPRPHTAPNRPCVEMALEGVSQCCLGARARVVTRCRWYAAP